MIYIAAAIIKEQNLTFPKKVALGEDGLFNMQFLEYAQSVRYIDYVGYHYREVVGSATRNSHRVNYFHRALEVFNEELPLFIRAFLDASSEGVMPKVVVVVNLYGQSAKMDEIMALCQAYGVPMIEDAAESSGAFRHQG